MIINKEIDSAKQTRKLLISGTFFLPNTLFFFKIEQRWIQHNYSLFLNGPQRGKTCLRGFANNTGADQSDLGLCYSRFLKVSYVNLLQVKFQFSS